MPALRLVGGALVLLLVGIGTGGHVLAQPAAKTGEVKPSIVAIVDVQRILQSSSSSKSVQSQLEIQRSKFQTEIAVEEAELRKAEQELVKLRETSKPED